MGRLDFENKNVSSSLEKTAIDRLCSCSQLTSRPCVAKAEEPEGRETVLPKPFLAWPLPK